MHGVPRWLRILVAGVGGQGVLSAGRWIGDAAHGQGLSVVVRQVHGMSQRGGSVHCSVVIGGARSPEIPDGMADVLLALEPMEGARVLAKVSRRTVALVNTRPVVPGSLQSTGRPYPALSSLLGPIEETAKSLVAVDASALAEQVGSPRSVNVVMLGMLAGSGCLHLPGDCLIGTIVGGGIPAFAEANRRAFQLGVEVVKSAGGQLTEGSGEWL